MAALQFQKNRNEEKWLFTSIYFSHPIFFTLAAKELELYKEELVSKPALLVVNKMDLPDAEDKLAELKEQLQSPHGKVSF